MRNGLEKHPSAAASRHVQSRRASRNLPQDAALTWSVVLGQVGFILIVLGVMLAFGVFLSLNFGDPSRFDTEAARQIVRVAGSAVLVVGILLTGFSTVRARNY